MINQKRELVIVRGLKLNKNVEKLKMIAFLSNLCQPVPFSPISE